MQPEKMKEWFWNKLFALLSDGLFSSSIFTLPLPDSMRDRCPIQMHSDEPNSYVIVIMFLLGAAVL